MIAGAVVTERVRETLERGVRSATPGSLVSVVESIDAVDPVTVFDAATGERFYWRPAAGPELCATGVVWESDRASAVSAWRTLIRGATVEGPATFGTGPILTGCLAFDPTRATSLWKDIPLDRLILPRFLVTRAGDRHWLTVNLIAGECFSTHDVCAGVARLLAQATTPSATASGRIVAGDDGPFRNLVAEAVAAIGNGELRKVVAARAVEVAGEWQPGSMVRHLRRSQPSCTTFAVATGRACFLGATPEWLVRLQHGEARVSCLAGTAPRGRTVEEDHRLGQGLLVDPKNVHEHALVLDAIRESLDGVARDLIIPPEPALMRLPNLQHLFTPVTALGPRKCLLEMVERLHPTPAMCGLPRERAFDFLREREGLDRGPYAGPIGWIDERGEGEFAVGIRSALLRGNLATAFAGCGIVADSHPASEVAESNLKLQPMLAALGAGDVL